MGRVARYSPEQIVAKLREHERLQGQGLTIPQACKRIGLPQNNWTGFHPGLCAATGPRQHALTNDFILWSTTADLDQTQGARHDLSLPEFRGAPRIG